MKKLIILTSIVLGMTIGGYAQGGLFGMGPQRHGGDYEYSGSREGMINLPSSHGGTDDAETPLGGGALLLIGFGAAYVVSKKRNK